MKPVYLPEIFNILNVMCVKKPLNFSLSPFKGLELRFTLVLIQIETFYSYLHSSQCNSTYSNLNMINGNGHILCAPVYSGHYLKLGFQIIKPKNTLDKVFSFFF